MFEEKFDSLVTYALRMADESFLRELPDVNEGLENAIKKAAFLSNSVKGIADEIKSKRYAYTRIKRIMYNALLRLTSKEREKAPEYIRVLALNDKGREILKSAGKKASLPIITNVTKKDFEKYPGIKADYLAASVYAAVSGENTFGLKAEII